VFAFSQVKKLILAVSLELYDNATHTAITQVLRKQLFDETLGTFGALVCSKRVLATHLTSSRGAALCTTRLTCPKRRVPYSWWQRRRRPRAAAACGGVRQRAAAA